MKKSNLLFMLFLVCSQALGQDRNRFKKRTYDSTVSDSITFRAPKNIDPSLHAVDSFAFHQLFKDSKLLGQWEHKCCFYYDTIQSKALGDKLNFLIIAREGHYTPYLILTASDESMNLLDEMILAKHFVDAGEAIDITSTLKENKIEQTTLDYNIGYEPFYKEIKNKFLITENGKFKLVEKTEELKQIK